MQINEEERDHLIRIDISDPRRSFTPFTKHRTLTQQQNRKRIRRFIMVMFILCALAVFALMRFFVPTTEGSGSQDKNISPPELAVKSVAHHKKADLPDKVKSQPEKSLGIEKKALQQFAGFPKQVWTVQDKSQISHLITKNQRYYLKSTGHNLIIVSKTNYTEHLSKSAQRKIEDAVIAFRRAHRDNPQLVDRWQNNFILANLLQQNGGVAFFEPTLLLTQSLEWLTNINQSPYTNSRESRLRPRFVGFFDPKYRNVPYHKLTNITQPLNQPIKFVNPTPFISPYFMASVPHSEFLNALCNELYLSATKQTYFENLPAQIYSPRMHRGLDDRQIIELYFGAVGVNVLRKKCHSPQGQFPSQLKLLEASQNFGLSLLNINHGPNKMLKHSDGQFSKQLRYFISMSQRQLEENFGRVRYMLNIRYNPNLFQLLADQNKYIGKVMEDSLVHRLLFFEQKDRSFLSQNPQKPKVDHKAPEWTALPKKVWVIWDKGVKNSSVLNQLSVENIRRKAKSSQYKLTIIDNHNVHDFLDKETIKLIDKAISSAKIKTIPHIRTQLIRIALVIKHGGVYMDSYLVLLEGLDWLTKIARQPSQHIFNRYGKLPKLVMSFDPYMSPDWEVDTTANTKKSDSLAYQNSFFAAQPNDPILREWFDTYIASLMRPYGQTEAEMDRLVLPQIDRLTSPRNMSLMAMQSLKIAIARKDAQIKQHQIMAQCQRAVQCYRLWSFSGLLGFQKSLPYYNLQSPEQNLNSLIVQSSMSYMESLIGPVGHFFKLFHEDRDRLNKFIEEIVIDNKIDYHPNSIIAKSLLDQSFEFKFVKNHYEVSFGGQNSKRYDGIKQEHHKKSKTEPNSHSTDGTQSQKGQSPLKQSKYFKSSFPKHVWMLQQQQWGVKRQLKHLFHKNRLHFITKSGYQLKMVSRENYTKHLSQSTKSAIKKTLNIAKQRLSQTQHPNKGHVANLEKTLILLALLMEKGGVIIQDPNLLLAEKLNWLEQVNSNPHVNRGHVTKPAEVVGFFQPKEKKKHMVKVSDIQDQVNKPLKFLEATPEISPVFIASTAGSRFIKEIWNELTLSVTDKSYYHWFSKDFLPRSKQNAPETHRMQENTFSLICLKVILSRAGSKGQLPSLKKMIDAMEHYGLALININYGPNKMRMQLENQKTKQKKMLVDLSATQLAEIFGPFRYLFKIIDNNHLTKLLEDKDNCKGKIMKGSFIQQRLFFQSGDQHCLYENLQKSVTAQNPPQWTALPKKVWVIWDKGIKKSHVINQICVQNMRRKAEAAGFSLTVVDKNNVNKYLDSDTLKRIDQAIKNAAIKTFGTTWPDLVRIALVAKHGGIYMDSTFVLLDDLSWLVNIAREPSQYIFNRYGTLPSVLLTDNPWYGNPADWVVDGQANTKMSWTLAYENNFFAAEPNHPLLKQWLSTFMTNLQRDYSQTRKEFDKFEVKEFRWTSNNDYYLMAMDSLKLAIAKKEYELKTNYPGQWRSAIQYYGAWSFNGYLGAQKTRVQFKFDYLKEQQNTQMVSYSREYMQSLIGPVRHLYKFYNHEGKAMGKYVQKLALQNKSDDYHPRSMLAKSLLYMRFEIKKVGDHYEVQFDTKNARSYDDK